MEDIKCQIDCFVGRGASFYLAKFCGEDAEDLGFMVTESRYLRMVVHQNTNRRYLHISPQLPQLEFS